MKKSAAVFPLPGTCRKSIPHGGTPALGNTGAASTEETQSEGVGTGARAKQKCSSPLISAHQATSTYSPSHVQVNEKSEDNFFLNKRLQMN